MNNKKSLSLFKFMVKYLVKIVEFDMIEFKEIIFIFFLK